MHTFRSIEVFLSLALQPYHTRIPGKMAPPLNPLQKVSASHELIVAFWAGEWGGKGQNSMERGSWAGWRSGRTWESRQYLLVRRTAQHRFPPRRSEVLDGRQTKTERGNNADKLQNKVDISVGPWLRSIVWYRSSLAFTAFSP